MEKIIYKWADENGYKIDEPNLPFRKLITTEDLIMASKLIDETTIKTTEVIPKKNYEITHPSSFSKKEYFDYVLKKAIKLFGFTEDLLGQYDTVKGEKLLIVEQRTEGLLRENVFYNSHCILIIEETPFALSWEIPILRQTQTVPFS